MKEWNYKNLIVWQKAMSLAVLIAKPKPPPPAVTEHKALPVHSDNLDLAIVYVRTLLLKYGMRKNSMLLFSDRRAE